MKTFQQSKAEVAKTFDEAYEIFQRHEDHFMSMTDVYAVGTASRDDKWSFVIKARKPLDTEIPTEIEGLKVVVEIDNEPVRRVYTEVRQNSFSQSMTIFWIGFAVLAIAVIVYSFVR